MYRLVLREIRAVREALATLVAHVWLCAFVHVHMGCQGRLDRKALTALRTEVLSRLRMRRFVVLELLFRDEALVTARMVALMRFVSGVAMYVPRQLRFVSERLILAAAGPVAVIVRIGLYIEVLTSVICSNVPVKLFGRSIVIVANTAADGPLTAVSPCTECGLAGQS